YRYSHAARVFRFETRACLLYALAVSGNRVGSGWMIKKLSQAALLIMGGLALGGCPFEQASTAKPANKPPAADYQAAVPASPPATNLRGICYTPADLQTYRARMLQMELNVITLQCQGPGGARAYESAYASFLTKFKADLVNNTRSLNQLAGRKRFNVDN